MLTFLGSCTAIGDSPAITFVEKGKVSKIAEGVESAPLLSACEEALMTSSHFTKLAVSEATISTIRKNEACVEIHYAKAREFTIAPLNRKVITDRLLIPLTGKHAETTGKTNFVTIFYGNARYESGPYISTSEFHNRIASQLSKLGFAIHDN